jgi:hypothetical protein
MLQVCSVLSSYTQIRRKKETSDQSLKGQASTSGDDFMSVDFKGFKDKRISSDEELPPHDDPHPFFSRQQGCLAEQAL